MIIRPTGIVAFASIAKIAYAQIARFTPPSESELTFSVNVPTSTSETNSGSIYIQIRGPTSKQWIALGQGSGMAGANIFVVYADGTGNVTVSPRLGLGHVEPQFNSDAQIELLAGSGIVDNEMIANFRCDTCLSWSGGDMQATDSSSNWIWSTRQGSPLNDRSSSADIVQHDVYGTFGFDLTRATGGSTNNPFVQAPASGTSSAGGPTSTSGTTPTNQPSSETDTNSGSVVFDDSSAYLPGWQKIHGVLMGLAFAVVFPIGAISIRVLPASLRADVHMCVQMIGFALSVAGLAYGVMLARDLDYLMEPHAVIGMVVMGGLFFQPIVGFIHHWLFKSRGKRTALAYIHTYWGRALLILAIINGGLGLQLADNTRSGEIAYGVVAGVLGAAWLASVAFYYIRGGSQQSPPSTEKSSRNEAFNRENYGGIDGDNYGGIDGEQTGGIS